MSYPHGRSGFSQSVGIGPDLFTGLGVPTARSTVYAPTSFTTSSGQAFADPQLANAALGVTRQPAGPADHTVAAAQLADNQMGLLAANVAPLAVASCHANANAYSLQQAQYHIKEQLAALKEAASATKTVEQSSAAMGQHKFYPSKPLDPGGMKRAQAALSRAAKHALQHQKALEQAQRETSLLAHTEAVKRARLSGLALTRALDQAQRAKVRHRRPAAARRKQHCTHGC
jgi:hypothetical protein